MKVNEILVASVLILLLAGSIPLLQPSKGLDPEPAWIPIIDQTVPIMVGPGSEGYVTFSSNSFGSSGSMMTSAIVQEAIQASPLWLQRDLAMKFDQLSDSDADLFASLILNTTDPKLIDEVAFVVAHSNVPTLTDQYFFPELFYDNARLIYETDPILKYVRIVEEEDYTTLAYIDGNNQERVLPREIYYWFVVHPDLGDDLPTYVDPDYNYTTDPPFDRNYGVAPPTGVFWRDHLLNYNKTGKPLLKDSLRESRNIREAIGAINGWVDRSMIFTSDQERPVQPVRIYEKGKGRCGEYQDMRSAAARIALIPVVAAANAAEDHAWNEFWDQRWVHWDGTVDNPLMYEKGWGKTISTVWDVRGDGLSWTVTERYSEEWSNLTVTVLDANGLPVDGAKVDLQTENYYQPDIKTTTASSSTTYDGKVTFTIGDGRNYWIRADGGSLGTAPINPLAPLQAITGSDGDVDYNVTLRLPRAADQKDVNPIEMTGSLPNVRIEIDIIVTEHTTFGTSSVSGGPYDGKGGRGAIDLFVLDRSNADNYGGMLPVDAYNLSRRSSQAHILLLPANTDIYELILSNGFSQSTYEVVNVTVRTFQLHSFNINTPADGSSFELGSRVEFKGTYYTPYDRASVQTSVDGGAWNPASLSGPSWTYSMVTDGLNVGPHEVRVMAKDDFVVTIREITIVLMDTTSPYLSAAPIASTFKSGDPIPLSGIASDLSGIRTLSLKIDDSVPVDIYTYLKNDGNWSYLLVTDGLSPGSHDLVLSALDPYENTASVRLSTTIVEGDPPELSLKEGIDRSLHAVRDIVQIEGVANDASGIVSLKLLVDTKQMDMMASLKDGVFSYDWDTRSESDGRQSLSLIATDLYGSASQIDFEVRLDGIAPTLELIDHDEFAGPSSDLVVSGRASDLNGIAEVIYTADLETILPVSSREGHFEVRIETMGWTAGNHRVYFRAADKAGNKAYSAIDVFYDDDPPEISTNPVPRIVITGQNLYLNGSVQDTTGIDSLTVEMDGDPVDLDFGEDGSFRWSMDTSADLPGERNLVVTALDKIGNVAQIHIAFRLVDERTDTDGDGMPDWWEFKFGLDPDADGFGLDTDGDGTTDLDEYLGDDGRPGNDDWSDPMNDGSRPSDIGHGGFPFLTAFIILGSIGLLCALVLYALIRTRRTH